MMLSWGEVGWLGAPDITHITLGEWAPVTDNWNSGDILLFSVR